MHGQIRKLHAGFFLATLACAILIACSSDDSAGSNDFDSGVEADGSGSDAVADGAGPGAPQCTPPAGSPPKGSPIIVTAPSPVAPGQVALLFGASVGVDAKVSGARLADDDPGSPPRLADCLPATATALDVLQAEDLSVKAVIPSTWSPGLFVLVAQNKSGAGAPVILNRPRIDWIQGGPGGAILSGGSFDVLGRSFGSSPRAWLTDASGKVTALSAGTDAGSSSDGYAATFATPTLAPGAYKLYVHSGLGGAYGFSDPLAVTVAAPTPWPTTVYAVAANTGNDDTAFATAITSATSGGGGIVQIASGNYTLTHGVVIPPKTVLRSATGNRSDVTITFDEAAIPFPFGFTGDRDFSVESLTVVSSTSARLFQCPNGPNYLRDPSTGGPQYQPDAPCVNAKLHDVSFTLSTLRDLVSGGVQTTTPTDTILGVMNGDDCEISDSTLVNNGGGVLSIAKPHRLRLLHNMLSAGSTRTPATQAMPLTNDQGSVGGSECSMYAVHESEIVGNTASPKPGLGASATMYIEYDAHNVYIADNTIGPNLSNYGEGFSFDAPYYPHFLGIPKVVTGRTLTIPAILNAAGNTVFEAPAGGTWAAGSAGSSASSAAGAALVGNSVVVVNGTGLGQYAEVISNEATAADGSTQLTIDRDFRIPLDQTSVIAITMVKSQVVFARNAFHDCAVGAQLYSGGYDFIIDGNTGQTMQGTYCIGNDFMSSRASATDLERRFSACYFDQWINNQMTNQVDATYPWAEPSAGQGVYTPYKNGFVGVQLGEGKDPLIPAQRGYGAVGNIVRDNQVQDFTLGLVHNGANGQMPNPLPIVGRDNVVEQNQTQSVPIGVFVDSNIPGSLDRNNTCTTGCTTITQNLNDGG